MRTVRMHPVALAAGFLLFSLSIVACKKSSSDPNPSNPTVISGCKPISETNLATGDTITRYGYDTQGRIALIKGKRLGLFGNEIFSSTVTYTGANEIAVRTLVGSGSSPVTESDRYLLVNGVITSSIDENADTSSYTYDAGKLKVITTRVHVWDSITISRRTFLYDTDGAVRSVTESYDSASVSVPYMTTTYTYDSKALPFVPLNPFSIGPGLNFIKLTKLITKMERVQFHRYEGFQEGFFTATNTYTPVYDGDIVTQITVTGPSISTNRVSKFVYQCK